MTDVAAKYPNLEKYEAWVKKMLVLGLYSPGGGPNGMNKAWMDHPLGMVKEYKGQLLGSLARNQIAWLFDTWSPQGAKALQNPKIAEESKKVVESDMAWIRQAHMCLDRLAQKEAEESKNLPPGFSKVPFAKQPPPAPMPTGEVQQLSFDTQENTRGSGSSGAPTTEPNTVSPPQPTAATERINADLMDPKFIKTAEHFLAATELARQKLREGSETDHKQVIGYASVLNALAQAVGLGREFELVGKGLRFEAYYRAGKLRGERAPGRPKKGEKKSKDDPWSESDHKLMSVLAKWEEDEFERLVKKGIEERNLSERSFAPQGEKSRGTPKDNAKSSDLKTEKQDPLRFLIMLAADIRTNPTWYTPQQALVASQDARIVENLGPVAQVFEHFCATLGSELKKAVKK
jgi:hypothetical protein